MDAKVIHFVLDSFMHFMPEDEVENFVRGLVGKRVLLMPDDNCDVDHFCIDAYYMGKPCGHASARKAPELREAMKMLHKRSLMVMVKSHNLDKGYKTAFCEIELDEPLSDGFLQEHLQCYQNWEYAGKSNVTIKRHKLLLANTDYLLERLQAEDATEEELIPVIETYLSVLPMAFSREDKENSIQVNILLQDSPLEGVKAYNSKLIEVLDYLNHSDQRKTMVREWIDELKGTNACRREAESLDKDGLALRVANLREFPENLYDCYVNDFATFAGNLYYNHIPCWEQQRFMNGVAVYELASERLNGGNETAAAELSDEDKRLLGRLLKYVARGDWQAPATADNVQAFFKEMFTVREFRDFFKGGRGGANTDRVEVSMANVLGYMKRYQLLAGGQQQISKEVFGNANQVGNINKGNDGKASQAFRDLEPLMEGYRQRLIG